MGYRYSSIGPSVWCAGENGRGKIASPSVKALSQCDSKHMHNVFSIFFLAAYRLTRGGVGMQGSGLRELQQGIFGAYKGGIICCTPSSWPPTSLYSVCGTDCITAVANDDSFLPPSSNPPTRLVCNTQWSGTAKRGSCHGSLHRRNKTLALPLGTQVTLET